MKEKIYFKDSKNYFTYVAASSDIRPLIVVIPGGGYDHTSRFESENVAAFFISLGFHAVILNYREELNVYPDPQMELAYVNNYFRENKEKYNISDKILNIGFSAGAHLVLSCAEYYIEYGQKKPIDALILCYPVVSSDNLICHKSSFNYLLQDKMSDALLDKLSLERHVTKNIPDVFLWTTITDNSVNPLNSIRLLESFYKNNVNCESHIYTHGVHGMSLADKSMTNGKEDLYIHEWTNSVKNWLIDKKFI